MKLSSIRLPFAALCSVAALTGCPSDDTASGTGDDTTTGSTTSQPGTSVATPPVTATGAADSTTGDGPGTTTDDSGTAGGDSGTTSGDSGTTTDDPTTRGSSGTTDGESSGGMMGVVGFGDCLSDPMACIDDELCVTDGAAPTLSVCADLDCADAMECPLPPPGGDAVVTCADLTGDALGDCYLDCSGGEDCPTGMDCYIGGYCAWPAPEVGYGDCDADPTVCLDDETCIVDNAMDPTISVCAELDCADVDDCAVAPPGGDAPVVCEDVSGDMLGDCFLDCSGGEMCPTGMDCFSGLFCAWPVAPPAPAGFAECDGAPENCLAAEACVVDAPMAPTISVCTDLSCGDAAECPSAPAGGAAAVVCTDVTGDGTDDCILDCNGGVACPPGMDCFADLLCAWPV